MNNSIEERFRAQLGYWWTADLKNYLARMIESPGSPHVSFAYRVGEIENIDKYVAMRIMAEVIAQKEKERVESAP